MANISNRIAVILDLRGMTQVDLAKASSLDEGHLNRIIKGMVPRLDTAFRICKALDLPVDKVFIQENGQAA